MRAQTRAFCAYFFANISNPGKGSAERYCSSAFPASETCEKSCGTRPNEVRASYVEWQQSKI